MITTDFISWLVSRAEEENSNITRLAKITKLELLFKSQKQREEMVNDSIRSLAKINLINEIIRKVYEMEEDKNNLPDNYTFETGI